MTCNNQDFVFVFEGFNTLSSSLSIMFEEDLDPDLRFKMLNITKMMTYVLTQMMRGFEDKLSQKTNNGILIDTGKVSVKFIKTKL
jgi:hypothetical protein